MSPTLTYDESLWPLLRVSITGVMTNEQCEQFFARSESLLKRGEKYVSISDIRQAGTPPLAQCHQVAEWMRRHTAAMRKCLLCNIIIITSAPLRLSTSLVFHLVPPPMPHLVVADMASAVEAACGRLVEARLDSDAERVRRHFATTGLRAE